MKTYQDFAEKHNLELTSKRVTHRNDELMDDEAMHHYELCLTSPGRKQSYTFNYSMGSAFPRDSMPEMSDVLCSLALDYSGFIGTACFESWASDFGYDEDSRKAEKIYNAVRNESMNMEILLGRDACEDLIYNHSEDGE